MLRTYALGLACASLIPVFDACAQPWGDTVIDYHSGSGFAAGYTNPATALGVPSQVTPGMFGSPVDPFNPPYLPSQIVSIGAGGSLTVAFNSPILDLPNNPFGLDLIIFGNNGFTIVNGDFSGGGITDGSTFTFDPPGSSKVFVSENNSDFFELVPPSLVTATVDGLFPIDGSGDFQIPVNPELMNADFAGLDLAGIRALYANAGGGTGFDLEWAQTPDGEPLSLSGVRFVRVDVLSGKVEIDGFAAVPEPALWQLCLLGAGLLGLTQLWRLAGLK